VPSSEDEVVHEIVASPASAPPPLKPRPWPKAVAKKGGSKRLPSDDESESARSAHIPDRSAKSKGKQKAAEEDSESVVVVAPMARTARKRQATGDSELEVVIRCSDANVPIVRTYVQPRGLQFLISKERIVRSVVGLRNDPNKNWTNPKGSEDTSGSGL